MDWLACAAIASHWRARSTVTVSSISAAARPTNEVPNSAFNAMATRSGTAHPTTGRSRTAAAANAARVACSWSGWPVTPLTSKATRWLERTREAIASMCPASSASATSARAPSW
ncbi:hypothetical protein GCM10029964_056830 [Kibdelosporangium lantanae]